MRATRFNHVSIHAVDLDESVRFYTRIFGMERIPAPTFQHEVVWLQLGDQQLHIFRRETAAPEFHHFGLDVDDFEAAYVKARELGLEGEGVWSPVVRELPDGSVQMYVRDPAGNLVEIDWPDVSTLDHSVVTEIQKLSDTVEQSEEARRATLYLNRTHPALPTRSAK
jgi:YD repeat-containing protein